MTAACPECGHAVSDHREPFGCIEPTLMRDGESWHGCPCELIAVRAADLSIEHDDNGQAQWEADHPGGAISADEQESMDRYAVESCREERCAEHQTSEED